MTTPELSRSSRSEAASARVVLHARPPGFFRSSTAAILLALALLILPLDRKARAEDRADIKSQACAGLAGCNAVKPWEHGTLADYTMRSDRDPQFVASREHVFFSREATHGGRGVGGGGSGCN